MKRDKVASADCSSLYGEERETEQIFGATTKIKGVPSSMTTHYAVLCTTTASAFKEKVYILYVEDSLPLTSHSCIYMFLLRKCCL